MPIIRVWLDKIKGLVALQRFERDRIGRDEWSFTAPSTLQLDDRRYAVILCYAVRRVPQLADG